MIADLLLASYGALWLITVVNVVILLATLRSVGMVLTRLPVPSALSFDDEGPAIGSTLPAEVLGIRSAASARPTVVVFLSTSCALCQRLAPSIRAFRKTFPTQVLIKGEADKALRILELLGEEARLYARIDDNAFGLAAVEVTPFALVVDETGTVTRKGLVNTLQQLESLVFAPGRSISDDVA